MTDKITCPKCGAAQDLLGDADTLVCVQCGQTLDLVRGEQRTVQVDPKIIRALWHDDVGPHDTPQHTLKHRETGAARSSRLVVKPRAVTSGAADPTSPPDYELL